MLGLFNQTCIPVITGSGMGFLKMVFPDNGISRINPDGIWAIAGYVICRFDINSIAGKGHDLG